MPSLADRLKKNTTVKATDTFGKVDIVRRDPASTVALPLNLALQGAFDGGVSPGITMFAAPSRHFKTNISLVCVSAWMDKYPDSIMLFYDSEFGAKESYFQSAGIDIDRVIHTPIKNIEELKFDLFHQLEALEKNDNVIIVIDSVGNLASKREVDNAENQNSAADMTRAKELKSLWRIVTPYFESLGIPCIVVNHVYTTMEMFSKTVVSGGQGNILASNDIIVIGRQQDKDKKTKELKGYNFILNVEKSRTVREGRKIPLLVHFDGGIMSYASLLDIAVEAGLATPMSGPWYAFVDPETGEIDDKKFMRKDTVGAEFWEDKLTDHKFTDAVTRFYRLDANSLIAKAEAEADDEHDA
jgi:RecA/RadA recombinase